MICLVTLEIACAMHHIPVVTALIKTWSLFWSISILHVSNELLHLTVLTSNCLRWRVQDDRTDNSLYEARVYDQSCWCWICCFSAGKVIPRLSKHFAPIRFSDSPFITSSSGKLPFIRFPANYRKIRAAEDLLQVKKKKKKDSAAMNC